MYRALYFLMILFIPILFGWWLFIPLGVLFIYLAKVPYEIIVVAGILDSVYYFGDGLISKNRLLIFALVLILVALFLKDRVHWQKVI